MKRSTLNTYIQLRFLVGYLGEKSQAGWWPTSFLAPTSRSFLEPAFPRTFRLAQYNGVREAARCLHDEYIGLGNVFHLFRLPEEVEQDLYQLIVSAPEAWFAVLGSWDLALSGLETIASGGVPVSEGPQSITGIKQLYLPSGAKAIAQHYLSAFKQAIRTFPYFVG